MKKYFKPSSLLFYLFVIILFFIIGTAVASWSGVADNQGLAAAAIVLGYGLITALIAMIPALIVIRLVKPEVIRKVNITFGIIVLLTIGILAVRFYSMQGKRADQQNTMQEAKKPTHTAPVAD